MRCPPAGHRPGGRAPRRPRPAQVIGEAGEGLAQVAPGIREVSHHSLPEAPVVALQPGRPRQHPRHVRAAVDAVDESVESAAERPLPEPPERGGGRGTEHLEDPGDARPHRHHVAEREGCGKEGHNLLVRRVLVAVHEAHRVGRPPSEGVVALEQRVEATSNPGEVRGAGGRGPWACSAASHGGRGSYNRRTDAFNPVTDARRVTRGQGVAAI